MEVLIVGAGIAGLSAAIGLGRSGHRVTIVEAAKGLIPVGAGIQMPPNATRVFRDWGILDAVKVFATVPEEVCFRAYRSGSVLHRHRLSPDTQDNFGSPHLQIHRRQLIEVLYQTALEAGAVVRFGRLVQHVERDPTKTNILVAGGESFQADLVVAGDGERSILRSLMLGKPNAPVSTGTLVYRLNVDPQALLDDPELSKELKLPIMCSWLGPDAHAVVYNLDYNDMVTVAITCPDPEKGRVQLGPREASIDELKAVMAGWDPMLLKLLDLATDVRFWTLLQLPEENRVWQSGRTILIGDAAHSMTPYIAQGASQSIEDGAFLGHLFPGDTTVEDIEPRLKQFCDRRQARTLKVRARAHEVGAIFQMADGVAQEARDEQMRQGELTDNFPNPFADPLLQSWLYTYDVKKDAEEATAATRKA